MTTKTYHCDGCEADIDYQGYCDDCCLHEEAENGVCSECGEVGVRPR